MLEENFAYLKDLLGVYTRCHPFKNRFIITLPLPKGHSRLHSLQLLPVDNRPYPTPVKIMSTKANFDNRGGCHSSTPSSPLPPDIVEILAQQQSRMDELLEQERAQNRRELAEALKTASKAQEGRIYRKMRRKVIDEELPRIRLLLKQELAPLVMDELKVENARATPNNDRQDSWRTTNHHLDCWDGSYRSPERGERQHRHRSRSRRLGKLEQQRSEEDFDVRRYKCRCSVNNEDSETKRATLLPSEMQAPRHSNFQTVREPQQCYKNVRFCETPRGVRRSSSEAQLDQVEKTHTIESYGSKRVRTGPRPMSMRKFPEISHQPSIPPHSPRRHITRPQPKRPLSPLSRATQAYLQAERAIPSIETDGPPLTKEQLKDSGRCIGSYTRSLEGAQDEGFVPSTVDSLPRETSFVGRPLTPILRQNGVGSEDDLLSDNLTHTPWNSPAGSVEQTHPPHGAPPLRQPQEAENTLGLAGRIPHGWCAFRADVLQKTLEKFPYKEHDLSSEFIPLLVFYDQRHILIECHGFYFFWHEPTNYLEKIKRPEELQGILEQMDHGRLLPRNASLPAHSAPLTRVELIRAEDLRYWSSSVVIHRRRSSIDRPENRPGSESIHEPNANNFNKRDGENGDNFNALYSRYLDNTRGAFDHRDSREPGYDASCEDNNTQEAVFRHRAANFSPSFSLFPSFEEGATSNNAIDLVSSPPTLSGSPTYDRYTRSNSDSRFIHPDAYWDHVPDAPRHPDSKALSLEEFDEQEMVDRHHGWEEGIVDWERIQEQLGRDEEQYP